MPAPTWHWFASKPDVDIELPGELAFARQVEVQCAEGLLGDEGAFDAALLSMADPLPVAAAPLRPLAISGSNLPDARGRSPSRGCAGAS